MLALDKGGSVGEGEEEHRGKNVLTGEKKTIQGVPERDKGFGARGDRGGNQKRQERTRKGGWGRAVTKEKTLEGKKFARWTTSKILLALSGGRGKNDNESGLIPG